MGTRSIQITLPENGMRGTREETSRASLLTEARKPPKKAAADAEGSSWFNAGVEAYPKAEAYASLIEVSSGVLSELRSGKRSVALRRLLPMQGHAPSAIAFVEAFLADVKVAEHPHEVLALVAPLLEEIGYIARPKGAISPEQVGAVAARLLTETSASREMLERECHREYGATPADVAMALRKTGDAK